MLFGHFYYIFAILYHEGSYWTGVIMQINQFKIGYEVALKAVNKTNKTCNVSPFVL